jgi:hypothetical protein
MCQPNGNVNPPSPRSIISNWNDYPGTATQKLKLALRNMSLRLMKRSTCCGNHGQPGC